MVHIHLRSNEEAAAAAAAAAAAGGSRKSCPCFRALPSCESERAGAQRQQEQEEAETAR